MPVESTRRSKPALLREDEIWTFKSCCRLHRVLKSETGHARPHTVSVSTPPSLWFAQRQAKQVFKGQTKRVAASENLELRPSLPLVEANQAMRLSNQIDSDPRALRAALYCFQCVVR